MHSLERFPKVNCCPQIAACRLFRGRRRGGLNASLPAFVRSDFTYLVPEGSPISAVKDVDRPGVRVAAVLGHASTAALLRMVKQATPVYAETP